MPQAPITERQAYETASMCLLLFGNSMGLLLAAASIVVLQSGALDLVAGAIVVIIGAAIYARKLPAGWKMKQYFSTTKLAANKHK